MRDGEGKSEIEIQFKTKNERKKESLEFNLPRYLDIRSFDWEWAKGLIRWFMARASHLSNMKYDKHLVRERECRKKIKFQILGGSNNKQYKNHKLFGEYYQIKKTSQFNPLLDYLEKN